MVGTPYPPRDIPEMRYTYRCDTRATHLRCDIPVTCLTYLKCDVPHMSHTSDVTYVTCDMGVHDRWYGCDMSHDIRVTCLTYALVVRRCMWDTCVMNMWETYVMSRGDAYVMRRSRYVSTWPLTSLTCHTYISDTSEVWHERHMWGHERHMWGEMRDTCEVWQSWVTYMWGISLDMRDTCEEWHERHMWGEMRDTCEVWHERHMWGVTYIWGISLSYVTPVTYAPVVRRDRHSEEE